MTEQTDWRPINGPGLPEGSEVDTLSGEFRVRRDNPSDEDGIAGDREPRNPKVPSSAGSMALELSQADENA